MKKYLIILLSVVSCNLATKDQNSTVGSEVIALTSIDSMQIKGFIQKAFGTPLHSLEHQQYLDSALAIQPDNGWLWQQKAMPLYKARKYQLGKSMILKNGWIIADL